MNAARWFQRRADYQPPQTPSASPFRKFDVKCLARGAYQSRLLTQMDEEAGEMSVVLVCNRCRNVKSRPSAKTVTLPWSKPFPLLDALACALM